MEGCVISNNVISYYHDRNSAGAYIVSGVMDRCIIVDNVKQVVPGVSVRGGTLRNSLVMRNRDDRAGKMGQGVYLQSGVVESCTVVDNTGDAGGVGILVEGGTVSNCVAYYNGDGTADIDQTGGTVVFTASSNSVAGTGNITDAPLFEDRPAGDYSLIIDSPCRDTGAENISWMTETLDLAGNDRVAGSTVDMGAYESLGLVGTILVIR